MLSVVQGGCGSTVNWGLVPTLIPQQHRPQLAADSLLPAAAHGLDRTADNPSAQRKCTEVWLSCAHSCCLRRRAAPASSWQVLLRPVQLGLWVPVSSLQLTASAEQTPQVPRTCVTDQRLCVLTS